MSQDPSNMGDLLIDRDTLRKQWLSLTLPKPKMSSALQAAVGRTYESLCEEQPIGRKLFQQFLLASNPQYMVTTEFLEELSDWSFAEGEAREKAKQSILAKFCQPESRSFLFYLTGEAAERCKDVTDKNFDEVMLGQIREATKDFLRGRPFSEYLKSPFYYRFLQWKEYEKQRITDRYFYELRPLGKGGFGEVCAVQVKHTGHMYACKKLDKRRLKKKGEERMALMEKQILEQVNSLFIVNLAYAYDNKTHLCLVMDLMNGGDLSFHIYELGERGIRMERVVYYMAQIITGLLHLHSMDIVYRDMKPENVLLDAKGQCRLSDFGLAVELPKHKTICRKSGNHWFRVAELRDCTKIIGVAEEVNLLNQSSMICKTIHQYLKNNTKAGTPGYMAPEILRQEYYRTSVDWWALGCSFYEMVAARLPFKDFKEKVQNEEVTRRILEDECKFEHKHFDAPTKDIISRFLKKKVIHRLGCQDDDPRNHVFFKSINFRRLEAGLVEPPWVPKSNVVYARDMDKFRHTSEVENIMFEGKDETFFKQFSTGAVSIQWQKEMIDSGMFDELNNPKLNGYGCESVWESRMCIIL